jgi:cytochrome c-type biogenesis protein
MSTVGPFALAFVAGVISFTSPCCLPLMPGYLSYVSGVAGDEHADTLVRARVLRAAGLFVLGFSIVFTMLGAGFSLFGGFLFQHGSIFLKAAGAFVIAMGLVNLGVLRVPFLFRELRFDLRRIEPGVAGAIPLGMAFAFGWTPCIGPVLGGILTAAAATKTAARGGALLLTYSLGLGIPFLLLAIGYAKASTVFAWLRAHGRGIERFGGGILIVMGVLMITGNWVRLFIPLIRFFSRSGWPPI